MGSPKEKALRVQPQSLKSTIHNVSNNITPFRTRASIDKDRLKAIAYQARCAVDVLEENSPALSTSGKKAAFILLRKYTNNILRIAGGAK